MIFLPLRTLLTAVLWKSLDGLNGSGTPEGGTSSTFELFWVVSYYLIESIWFSLLMEQSLGTNRIALEVQTSAVPLSLYSHLQRWFGDLNVNISGASRMVNCVLGKQSWAADGKQLAGHALGKRSCPQNSAISPQMCELARCIVIIQLHTCFISPCTRSFKKVCEVLWNVTCHCEIECTGEILEKMPFHYFKPFCHSILCHYLASSLLFVLSALWLMKHPH